MANLEDHYPTPLQGIRRPGGTVQVYANLPLPLASALDREAGETVTGKGVDRTPLLWVRWPERKPLPGVARPSGEKADAARPGGTLLRGTRSPQVKRFAADPI